MIFGSRFVIEEIIKYISGDLEFVLERDIDLKVFIEGNEQFINKIENLYSLDQIYILCFKFEIIKKKFEKIVVLFIYENNLGYNDSFKLIEFLLLLENEDKFIVVFYNMIRWINFL